MRYLFFFAILLAWGTGLSQGSGFTFNYTGPSQILVGPSCEAALNWGHPNTPTVTSNIPGGMIVSFTIYSISGGYEIGDLIPGGSTVTVFYQALDNFGNTALFGFTIAFVDVLPPVFDHFSLPSNITVSCLSNVPPPADVEATDNCENENTNLTITYTQTNNAQSCTGGSIIRTWVADDDLGNFATFIQTITVLADNTPPVIANNLVNGMAPCSTAMAQYSTWLNTQRANFSATDSGCGIMSLTDNAPSPAIITSFCGAIDVTFTAKDNCNNTSTVVKTFTVFNSIPPVITTPASGANGNCSQNNIAQLFSNWINTHGGATATDDCSSIFWTTFPASPSIADTCDAAIVVMFIAGDGCNNFDTTTASFILIDDTAPVITTDPASMILSCSATNLDSLLMDWLVTGGHSEANDLCTPDDDLVLGYRIGNVEFTLQEVLDAWQDSLDSGCQDNVIIGGIGINNVKAYIPVQFTYTDNCDNVNGKIGFFGITDNGRPTFVTLPVDTSFACSQSNSWEDVFLGWYNSAGGSTYMDVCSDVSVTASITADSAVQYLAAALDTACLQGVEVTISFTLTDDCGNNSTISPSGTFSLQDTISPVLTSTAPDIIVACSQNAQMQLETWIDTLGGAEATDGCGELTWEFMWLDTAGMLHTGIPGTGPYPPLNELDCAAGIEVIFVASDICQNTVSDTAVFSIIDSLPPVIVITEDTIQLGCQDTIPIITPLVTDGCDNNPLVTVSDSVSIDSCFGLPSLTLRTWTATDACGNSSTAQVWFFSTDTIAPTFELPADTVAFCSIDTLLLINVSDNCDPSPVTSWEDQLIGPACEQTLTRTWIVTDACGNSTTAIQQFDLSDDSPPVIIYSPGDFVYACDAASADLQTTYEQWMDSVVVEDGCSEANYFIALRNSYVLEDTSTWPGTPLPDSIMAMCGLDLALEADLVVYDECENVVVEEISFSVIDTVGPVFVNCPTTITIQPDSTCDALVTLTSPAFEEVCFPENITLQLILNGGDTIDLDSTLSIDTLLTIGIYQVVWIATDCNNNQGVCNTSLEIFDVNAIQVTCPPDTLVFATFESCQMEFQIFPPKTETGTCGTGVRQLSGYIEGMAEPSVFVFDSLTDTVFVQLTAGLHTIFLIGQDSTGVTDTCSYIVELRDTFPPDVICQSGIVLLPPSGLENIDVSTASLISSVLDACGIDTILYTPPTVNCSNNGQSVPISITVFDQNGNSSTCETTIDVSTQPLLPLWESQLCDDTLRLFANLPGAPDTIYTFSWSGPNGYASTAENPVLPDTDTSFSGTYLLTVTSDNGCVSTGSIEVLILELSAPTISVNEDTICTGEEVLFTTQSFSGDVIYQWYHIVVAGDTLLGSTTEPLFPFTPTLSGIYSVYAVISQDTCASEPGLPVDIVVVDAPVATIANLSTILCVQDTLFLSPVSIIDSLQYVWNGPNGYESFDPAPAGIPASEIDSSAVFTLIVSNAYCSSTPDSIVIDIQQTPATPVIAGDTLACEGGSITLTTVETYSSYVWIDPLGNTFPTDNDTLILSTVTMDQSGEWQVIGFENGCASDTSASFVIQIDSSIQIQIETLQQVCEGDSISLSITPFINAAFSWTGPGGFVSDESSPTVLAESGVYAVSILTSTGCEAADSIDVIVDFLPVINSLQTDAVECANGIDPFSIWVISTPPSSPGYVYTWDGPGSFTVLDTSIVFDSATAAINGIYTLSISNGSCITETSSIVLDVNDSPAAPIIEGENVYCDGDSIILNIASPIGGATYAWTSQDTNVVINSPGTLIVPDATSGWTGVYSVSVTADGCTSPASIIAVQVKAPLSAPSILSPPLVCEGDSLVLISNAPAGALLNWISSNGFESTETQPVIFPVLPSDAGTYQLVYEINGCTSPPSNPFDIDVQQTIAAPVITTDITQLCIDAPIPVTLCVDPESLVGGATYTWILNGNTLVVSPGPDSCITIDGDPLQGGINSITAISSVRGCPSDTGAAVIIIGDEIPSQNADAGVDVNFCPGETIILDASDPTPGIGVWTSNDDMVVFSDETNPNAEIIGLPSGDYVLYWTQSFATCVDYSSDSVVISVLFSPEAFPDTVEIPFGQTGDFVVTLNDNTAMGPYTFQIFTSPQKGNALHVGNGLIRYTPNLGFVGTDMLIYRICATDCPEECSDAIVIIKVGNEDDCFIPSLFTPNNDGINDILIIPCLETERYPDNKIIIFNEWGDAVFTASPYQNDWDGTVSGESLPVGTYFYIMDFSDGNTPKRSFLILER